VKPLFLGLSQTSYDTPFSGIATRPIVFS